MYLGLNLGQNMHPRVLVNDSLVSFDTVRFPHDLFGDLKNLPLDHVGFFGVDPCTSRVFFIRPLVFVKFPCRPMRQSSVRLVYSSACRLWLVRRQPLPSPACPSLLLWYSPYSQQKRGKYSILL